MSDEIIVKIMNSLPIITGMMAANEIYGVLKHLQYVLENNIPGDIIEFGCFVGTTSIFIRKMLDEYKSDRLFHVYESWKGLPKKHEKDHSNDERQFKEGMFYVDKQEFLSVFHNFSLKIPIIHEGEFANIPDDNYPNRIAFVFMDGDFYTSTRDALNKVYLKMTTDGIILIDDCGWPPLPGPKLACEEFLEDKEEELELTGYPNKEFQFGGDHTGGKIVKGGKKIVLHSSKELNKLTGPKDVQKIMPFSPPMIENTDISTLYKKGDNVLVYKDSTESWEKSEIIRFVRETNKYELQYENEDISSFVLLEPGGDNHFPMI